MNTLPRTATELAEHFIGPIVYQERFYFFVHHEEFLEILECC